MMKIEDRPLYNLPPDMVSGSAMCCCNYGLKLVTADDFDDCLALAEKLLGEILYSDHFIQGL